MEGWPITSAGCCSAMVAVAQPLTRDRARPLIFREGDMPDARFPKTLAFLDSR